jgi:hypothetical protein
MEKKSPYFTFENYFFERVPKSTKMAYEILRDISPYLDKYEIDMYLGYISSGEEDLAFYGITAPILEGRVPLSRATFNALCRFGESIPTPSYIFLELTGEDLTPQEWLQLEKYVVE